MPDGLLIGQHRFAPISVPGFLPTIKVAFLKDPVLALKPSVLFLAALPAQNLVLHL